MKIALAQMTSTDCVEDNLNQIIKFTEKAADESATLIVFPENCLYFRINQGEKINALSLSDSVFLKIQSVVDRCKIAVHLTTALLDVDQKVYNASLLLQPNQVPKVLYRKIHLFDITLKNDKPIRESDFFTAGHSENIFELNGVKFGSSICYDIRFAELYAKYAKAEVDVILVPAAFLVKTGRAHWDVLLRARAIESQCYVLAPAQVGRHVSYQYPEMIRETYGHTVAIDAWGMTVSQNTLSVGLIFCDVQKAEIGAVRQQIQMKDHRKL